VNEHTYLFSGIVRIVSIELGVGEDVVRRAGSLRVELSMDSVAAANILFRLEEEFGVELDVDVVEVIESMSDIEAIVVGAIEKGGL